MRRGIEVTKSHFGRLIPAAMMLAGIMLCMQAAPGLAEDSHPAAASDNATSGDVKHGEQIFKSICTHCHRTDYETSPVGAPGLRDVMERHTPEWEFQWLLSPAAFAKKDETARALTESNPYGLVMPTIPEMADPQNRRDVIEFLKTLKGK